MENKEGKGSSGENNPTSNPSSGQPAAPTGSAKPSRTDRIQRLNNGYPLLFSSDDENVGATGDGTKEPKEESGFDESKWAKPKENTQQNSSDERKRATSSKQDEPRDEEREIEGAVNTQEVVDDNERVFGSENAAEGETSVMAIVSAADGEESERPSPTSHEPGEEAPLNPFQIMPKRSIWVIREGGTDEAFSAISRALMGVGSAARAESGSDQGSTAGAGPTEASTVSPRAEPSSGVDRKRKGERKRRRHLLSGSSSGSSSSSESSRRSSASRSSPSRRHHRHSPRHRHKSRSRSRSRSRTRSRSSRRQSRSSSRSRKRSPRRDKKGKMTQKGKEEKRKQIPARRSKRIAQKAEAAVSSEPGPSGYAPKTKQRPKKSKARRGRPAKRMRKGPTSKRVKAK